MNVPWGLIVFIVGIAYGYMSPGRQDKSTLFKKGLLWGLVIALVLAVIGFLAPDFSPLGSTVGAMGFLGVLIAAVVLTLVFILGVWLGDWLEHRKSPGGHVERRM